ncbi:hypothetical protein PVAND_000139 [Polypedilum vanderplanki]|uniref:Uncharacterized protein n=1 Tax=Polypedilum vanderplanki TaxID=319348 RepID=A0A9J6BJG7_POLVA|nr:hypothetical protein PVAND_000139 [Polypedilum vanderplanki]
MINGSFEATDTPGKKRKRESFQKFVSSTPIKLSNNNNKENFVFSDSCMEVKSIAELVAERKNTIQFPVNEYEVIRKPPKKKKKSSVEECCFTNPGLDLKVDEKVINPFEVVRDDNTEAKILALGVTNPALDIQNEPVVNDIPSTNPFEVVRESTEMSKTVTSEGGIENCALELNPVRATALVLPLNFTPTVNHRIDFSNMPENLTPSALLSSKLVLENNEVKITIATPKRSTTASKVNRSLSIISEEEDAEIDIGAELDNYQLQLENSINEAKMQNRPYDFNKNKEQQQELVNINEKTIDDATFTKETLKNIEESTNEIQNNAGMLSGLKESNVDDENLFNDDVQFEEVDSFEDVGKLGQFKRAYRTEAPIMFKKPIIDTENNKPLKTSSKLGGSIRRSIRKLIHPKSKENNNENDKSSESEKHDGIFQTIRQSLRRKQKPKPTVESHETTLVGRQVFREVANDEIPKRTLERKTLKRNVIKTVKTFMESVEEFDHY